MKSLKTREISLYGRLNKSCSVSKVLRCSDFFSLFLKAPATLSRKFLLILMHDASIATIETVLDRNELAMVLKSNQVSFRVV